MGWLHERSAQADIAFPLQRFQSPPAECLVRIMPSGWVWPVSGRGSPEGEPWLGSLGSPALG